MAQRIYTTAEKARRARLLAKGAKNAYGDTAAIDRELDRIEAVAEDRAQREALAYQRELSAAKDAVATARVRERAASHQERGAARQARKDAEKRLRDIERARR
ncbi:hypothetical protein [Streptomyces iconiensis]|uniref:Uncharacterized protein n=1 Tax=Streptomyces iconiensis TaxID=1384038 RepID=A0ABT7AB20_9ACTN|nr:hypothetical protein [Streptomyces iconiensis]MDJ1138545.1 hypothetical protein [Streptomyces iconiensis]